MALHIQQNASDFVDRNRKHCSSHSQSPLTCRSAARGIRSPPGIRVSMSTRVQAVSSCLRVGETPEVRHRIDQATKSMSSWIVWNPWQPHSQSLPFCNTNKGCLRCRSLAEGADKMFMEPTRMDRDPPARTLVVYWTPSQWMPRTPTVDRSPSNCTSACTAHSFNKPAMSAPASNLSGEKHQSSSRDAATMPG